MNEDLQRLLDRAAIHDLHMRYFSAADHADRTGVRACFSADVEAHYEGRAPVRGVEALIGQIALFGRLETRSCRVSTHFSGNVQFKSLSDAEAETEINAFACLVDADGALVALRSLRYLDRLRRIDGQWKICARVHTLDWSGELPVSFARAFVHKVIALPALP